MSGPPQIARQGVTVHLVRRAEVEWVGGTTRGGANVETLQPTNQPAVEIGSTGLRRASAFCTAGIWDGPRARAATRGALWVLRGRRPRGRRGTVNLSNPRAIFAGSPPRFTRSRVTYEAYVVSRTSTRPQVDSARKGAG